MSIKKMRIAQMAVFALMFSLFLTITSKAESSSHSFDEGPQLVKSLDLTSGKVLVSHVSGKETSVDIIILSSGEPVSPQVFPYPLSEKGKALENVRFYLRDDLSDPVKTGIIWADNPEAKRISLSVVLDKESKSGLYLICTGNDEPFVVKKSTSEKIALFAPEGFISALKQNGLTNHHEEGALFYFNVPRGLRYLELVLGRPQTVRNSRGVVVLEAKAANTGKITIPVGRNHGVWSIEPAFYGSGRLGVSPPSFVRFLNIAPVVSFAEPRRLPDWRALQYAGRTGERKAAKNGLEFVDGIDGMAVRLSGENSLVFPRGRTVEEGGYAHFPGKKGTIEFWFRPEWSSTEITIADRPFSKKSLIRTPHININYLYGGRNWNRQIYGDIQMELIAEREGIGLPSLGKQEQHFFKEDAWTHLAFTWEMWRVADAPPPLPPAEMVQGSVEWPSQWRIFGPLNRSDEIIETDVLNSYPVEIEVEGETFKARDVRVDGTKYDFPEMLDGEPAGRTAYVFIPFESPREQVVTLGMGADWWMQAWLNGNLIFDTTDTSNVHFPFSIWNHTMDVRVKEGRNILAVRFIKGGGAELALGGPDQLRVTPLPVDPSEIRPDDGMDGNFNIFVNGKKLIETRSQVMEPFLRGLTGMEIIELSDKKDEIKIGPLEGSLDILRISDTVRYVEDFVPAREAPVTDWNTRVLFNFDGSLEGVTTF